MIGVPKNTARAAPSARCRVTRRRMTVEITSASTP
jgi:hypothetical protein